MNIWRSLLHMLSSPFPQAYIQTSAAVSDAGETVAIIYEEDNAAYLCTPLIDAEEKLRNSYWTWGRQNAT